METYFFAFFVDTKTKSFTVTYLSTTLKEISPLFIWFIVIKQFINDLAIPCIINCAAKIRK